MEILPSLMDDIRKFRAELRRGVVETQNLIDHDAIRKIQNERQQLLADSNAFRCDMRAAVDAARSIQQETANPEPYTPTMRHVMESARWWHPAPAQNTIVFVIVPPQ